MTILRNNDTMNQYAILKSTRVQCSYGLVRVCHYVKSRLIMVPSRPSEDCIIFPPPQGSSSQHYVVVVVTVLRRRKEVRSFPCGLQSRLSQKRLFKSY